MKEAFSMFKVVIENFQIDGEYDFLVEVLDFFELQLKLNFQVIILMVQFFK